MKIKKIKDLKENLEATGLMIMGISFGGALSMGGHSLRVFIGAFTLVFIIWIFIKILGKKLKFAKVKEKEK